MQPSKTPMRVWVCLELVEGNNQEEEVVVDSIETSLNNPCGTHALAFGIRLSLSALTCTLLYKVGKPPRSSSGGA